MCLFQVIRLSMLILNNILKIKFLNIKQHAY